MASSSAFDVSCNSENDDANPTTTSTDPPASPFVTTSDVIHHLNKHLSSLSSTDPTKMGGLDQPRFELQKRLPNGSAVPATPEEIAAADFKTKLEQSATFVSQLATPDDRQYWAEQQRLMGNSYFARGDYRSAMDVYLTCLVVKDGTVQFVTRTLIPILNNLAQCTLHLGMHKKTVLFCEFALEECRKIQDGCPKKDNDNDDDDCHRVGEGHARRDDESPDVDPISLCKIYFKLAKAERLSGNYGEARMALNSATECLEEKKQLVVGSSPPMSDFESSPSSPTTPYRQAIQKEYHKLDVAEREARKLRLQQKNALQNALSSTSTCKSTSTMSQDESESRSVRIEPRKFSTLRARRIASTTSQSHSVTSSSSNRHPLGSTNRSSPSQLSIYRQYYWSMVARVTSFLLAFLGDDDEEENKKTTQPAKTKSNIG